MDIALIALPNVADPELPQVAEDLGFSSFYVGENTLMWSDSVVTLALAAQSTERIRLGTAVSIAGLRDPTVVAQQLGTLNLLAPGRVTCGVGTGNSAMRVLGRDPLKLGAYEQWVAELRPLLSREESVLKRGEVERVAAHMVPPERGYVSYDPPVPLYVSGFGPKTMAIAGRYGDGIMSYLGGTPEQVASAWEPIEAGAASVGKALDRKEFFTSTMLMVCVLEDGESPDSPRIREQAAPVSMLTVHYLYEQHKQLGIDPPPFLENIWDEYVAAVEAVPEERRGMRIHRGHGEWVPDEDERFVTQELIEATTIIGSPEEVAKTLKALEAADLDEVAVNPSPETARDVMLALSEKVMPLL